ncbi:MAG: DM13 domain-containing protein [bacterium]|nr:DM13 domain-containing protein [bacterium]MDE0287905.1 DM13 domain-containing protein [bacterium]MDE0439716.1 DM13 domain-containing protein [bacterium]
MSERPRFYKRRSVQIAAVVIVLPLAALAWWLLSPLFIDEVVDEPFPRAAMAVIPDDMTAEEVEQKMMEAETVDTPAYEDMPEPAAAAPPTTAPGTTTTYASGTTEADDPVEIDEGSEGTAVEESAGTTTTSPTSEEASPTPTTAPQQARPIALATGALMDADSFHKGSGEVTLYRLEDGTHLVRMEDISVTNGPQLHVLLTPIPSVGSRDDLQSAGYIDLGPLKGNKGSQNYEVPSDYPIPEEMTVVIYCVPFHVVFATAPLA